MFTALVLGGQVVLLLLTQCWRGCVMRRWLTSMVMWLASERNVTTWFRWNTLIRIFCNFRNQIEGECCIYICTGLRFTLLKRLLNAEKYCRFASQEALLLFVRLQKVHRKGPRFCPSSLPILHMHLLSSVLCSVFLQSLDFELESPSFDTFIISLFTA